jgi:hypothetical protein
MLMLDHVSPRIDAGWAKMDAGSCDHTTTPQASNPAFGRFVIRRRDKDGPARAGSELRG